MRRSITRDDVDLVGRAMLYLSVVALLWWIVLGGLGSAVAQAHAADTAHTTPVAAATDNPSSTTAAPGSSTASNSASIHPKTVVVNPLGSVPCATLVTANIPDTYSAPGHLTVTATNGPIGDTCEYSWTSGPSVTLTIGTDATKPLWEQFVLAFQSAAAHGMQPKMVTVLDAGEAFYAASLPTEGQQLVNRSYTAIVDGSLVTVKLVASKSSALEVGPSILSNIGQLMTGSTW